MRKEARSERAPISKWRFWVRLAGLQSPEDRRLCIKSSHTIRRYSDSETRHPRRAKGNFYGAMASAVGDCHMPQRNLVIVTQRVPFIGFCEACNASFMSYKPGAKDATQIV